ISVADGNGHTLTLRKDGLKSIKPSQISFMPEGMVASLNDRQIKDLMTFLLSSPLEPAQLEISGAPAPRTQAAINELLQQKTAAALDQNSASAPFNIVLCAGPKDHGPSEHDYPLWQKRWVKLLALKSSARVTTAWEWPSDEQWRTANVVIFYSDNPGWSKERA